MRHLNLLTFILALSISPGLIAAGTPAPSSAQVTEKANIGTPGGCPFENSTSTSDTIAKVKASLSAIAGSSDSCSKAVGSSAASLTSLLDGVIKSNFPVTEINVDGTTTLTCDNYTAILAKEKSLAMEAKNNEYFVVGTDFLTRYRSCEIYTKPESEISVADLDPAYTGLTQSQRYDLCVDTIYKRSFYRKVEECDVVHNIEYENNKNKAYRDQITQVTQMATKLISSSESCSNKDVLRNITQSIIPLITTIGTYSVGGPFLGAGVALGGHLASALVDRFFNTNGPNEYMALLDGESEWKDLNCLYYQVQNEALACNAPNFKDIPVVKENVSCQAERENAIISDLSSLSNIVKSLTEAKSPLDKAEKADKMRQYLAKEITYPDGSRKLPISEYLKEVAKGLSSDPSKSADMFQAARLSKILDNIDQYKTLSATKPVDTEKIMKNNIDLYGLVKDDSGTFDLTDTISRYWNTQERSYSSSMIGKLKAVEHPSPLNKILPIDANDMQSSASTKISHDALVDLYKKKFDNRLQQQQQSYLSNRKAKNDSQRNSNLDYIIPLFRSCTLNAGMFYYGEQNQNVHSLNLINEPSEQYKTVCAKFQCPDGSLLPKFNPSDSPDADSKGTQFKRYQCALNAQYSTMYKRLVDTYKRTGEICPAPKPARATPKSLAYTGAITPVRSPSSKYDVPSNAPEKHVAAAYDPDKMSYFNPSNKSNGIWSGVSNFFGGIFNFLFGWMK